MVVGGDARDGERAPGDDERFEGFPVAGVEFYRDLEEDNSREFWSRRRGEWERAVRDPMRTLLAELEDEFGEARMFRPHRDLRFSRDTSPYKTHQGALVGTGKGIGYYLQLSADGLLVGGGFRAHSPAETARYRHAVDAPDSGRALEAVVADLERARLDLVGAAVKTRPRGYPADHPRLALLRRTELMAVRQVGTPDWLATRRALVEVRDTWRRVRPLTEWVLTHVAGD